MKSLVKLARRHKQAVFRLDIVLRLVSVVFMWWMIIPGYVINSFLDTIDGDVLARIGIARNKYQRTDKILDHWWYTFLFIYMLMYFERNTVFLVLTLSYIYRTIGFVWFYFSDKEWLLFVFPGLFNWLFFFVVAFPALFSGRYFSVYLPISALILITLWREWKLHVVRIDMTNLLLPFVPEKRW